MRTMSSVKMKNSVMDSPKKEMTAVVNTLIDAAADKDELVREAVASSLHNLARIHPKEVLESIIAFRKHKPKLSVPHLMILLQTVVKICQEMVLDIDHDTVLSLIKFSIDEMTLNKEYSPDLQMPASNALVALGHLHCMEVMEGLLKHFQPGILPHYSILHTMGTLASTNIYGIVPFIKSTIGAMLPMLGMVRIDAMKQVFAYTLGKFSDAILEYLANIDKAPDPTVNREGYETEINIAYDVLVNSWLNTRDPKVCETILQALGPMFSLLSRQKVLEQIPRLIPTLLNLYRRGFDPYPVTQCLATVLLISTDVNGAALQPLLDNLLSNMFDMICVSPDYAQPLTVKNHYEVLRCYDRVARNFSDRIVDLIIQQLKNNNERDRLKSLFVATHLVNSSDNLIRSRISDIVAALRNMLGEQSGKVKRVLLKTIVAFAYRGFLSGDEGGKFVDFIVKHCSIAMPPVINKEAAEEVELRETCANTLYLLATTVPQFSDTLWPLLLNFLVNSQYTTASSTIALCLSHLAVKKKEELNLTENLTNTSGGIPSPYFVFGRCLSLLGCPLQAKRGIHILNFLKNYANSVSRLLRPLWERKIPELIIHLKECNIDWSDQVWEDLVLDFLTASLREIDEEKWTVGLGVKLIDQSHLYTGFPIERGMLMKCLAVTVSHTADKHHINQSLDVILGSTRQHTMLESKSCARALGICSRKHLEVVIIKLEGLVKDELSRKSSRLLGFMKDSKQESEVERSRLTLLIAYGQVASEATSSDLLPLIEENIANWVVQQMQVAKDLTVREVALRTLGNIADALHSSSNTHHVILQRRSHFLKAILDQLHQGQIHHTILQVATKFIKLPPHLSPEECTSILKICLGQVYDLIESKTFDDCGQAATGENQTEMQCLNSLDNILNSLGSVVIELLLASVCPSTLDDIFTLLEPWFVKTNSRQKLAAIQTLQTTLQCYLDNVKFGFENPSKFNQCGMMIGSVAPRCTDANMAVRIAAINCMRLTLCIAARYEGHTADYDCDLTRDLMDVQLRIQTEDPALLFKAARDLSQIVCTKLPHGQYLQFINSLIEGLLDVQTTSSSGASVILNIFLKMKGGEMYHHVSDILSSILSQMANIKCAQTRSGSVRAVLSLAHHHPKAIVTSLLCQSIPYDDYIAECWMILAQDPSLSTDIIEQFVQVVSTMPLYEDQKDKDKLRIAVLMPLSAISALREMFRVASVQEIACQRFPELFSMLMIALGCYVGTSPPIYTPQEAGSKHSFVPNRSAYKLNPARVALETFKAFLLCAKCEVGAEALLHCSHMEVGESMASFIELVPYLARAVCLYMPQSLPKFVVCLNQYGTSIYDPQRITVAAFYAELVSLKSNGEMVLLDSIMSSLLNFNSDHSPIVRRLCLKGLSAVSGLHFEQRARHIQPVLTALINGLDDQDFLNNDSVPLEAMRGFSQMLQVVDEEHIYDVQVSVALRIKPFFEKENVNIRMAAFEMFGHLAKYGGLQSKAAFQEQVKNNLLCLLLHLDDCDKSVIKACKYTLRQFGPLLDAERINVMMQDHLIDEANLHYQDFLVDVVKIMVEELNDLVPLLVMQALSYMKSSWPYIRGNAAIFIGLLCGSASLNPDNNIPIDTVCSRLILLLKDQDHNVRAKGAEAMSYLFSNM